MSASPEEIIGLDEVHDQYTRWMSARRAIVAWARELVENASADEARLTEARSLLELESEEAMRFARLTALHRGTCE